MTRQSEVWEAIADPRRRDHFVGVELGPAIIRAGVFSESLKLIGKTKFSTKLERGPMSVIERVAKCIHYAADECDLPVAPAPGQSKVSLQFYQGPTTAEHWARVNEFRIRSLSK